MRGHAPQSTYTIKDIVTTLSDHYEQRLPPGTSQERKAMFHQIKRQMRLKYPKCSFGGIKVVSMIHQVAY